MATVAAGRASATSSRAMRVFPIPAGPTIVESLHACCSRDRAKASRSVLFALPADERCRRRRDVFGLGQFEQPPRLHGRRATLDLEWLQRFRANVGLDQAVCAVAEQDLPRLRRLLQPRGDVDGIAGGEDLPPSPPPTKTSPEFTPMLMANSIPLDRTNSSRVPPPRRVARPPHAPLAARRLRGAQSARRTQRRRRR